MTWNKLGALSRPALAAVMCFALEAMGAPEPARAKLLEGVDGVPKFGLPSPVAVFGERAFAVIAGGVAGRSRMALCAAGELGKGRVLVFGHTGYLDGKVTDGGHRRLLLNAVAWCAGGRKARVGVRPARMEAFFSGEGLEAGRLDGALTGDALRGIDVLVLNAQGLTDAGEAAALEGFVRAGGGLIAAVTGWAFEQTSPGKVLKEDLAINRALAPAGLGFAPLTLEHAGDRFAADAELTPFLNAHAALQAFARQAGPRLSDQDLAQAASAVEVALAMQPRGKSAFMDAAASALGGIRAALPSAKEPLRAGADAGARVRLALETRLAQAADARAVRPNPAAALFPGGVPASAPRVTRDIVIDPRVLGWHSTGLYAAPGERITVTVPQQAADAGFAVRIGCHTDKLYEKDEWMRAPDISCGVRIAAPSTAAASAFGGLVYVEVPKQVLWSGRFTAKIEGAVPAPLFVLGRDDDAKWNSEIKMRQAPWAEFACERVVLTCPSEIARRVSNPEALMDFWTKVLDADAELAGIPVERSRPERIVADVQISAGYMHSGYPVMVPLGEAGKMVTRSGKEAPGWGFYHELGHNHQKPEWTFEGTGEVTCNLFSLWCIHRVLGERDPTVGHKAMAAEPRDLRMKKHFAAGAPFEAWKKDPFLALTLYWQLIDGFGWDALKRVIASYEGAEFGPPPKSEDEKRDQWMLRYSKVAGRNLAPFFERWGVPVGAAAKASVQGLEPWMPKGM